mmetsp:Transcript_20458/g.44467  ORF Transcript_20458/g.44467 Transcript_20458/m.44467 type:complete len:128 (-) Transcript_20458:1010-1393(-)
MRQRAGATVVLAKLQLGTSHLRRLKPFLQISMERLVSGLFEAKQAATGVLRKLLQEMRAPLTSLKQSEDAEFQQSQAAYKLLQKKRANVKLMSFAKDQRSVLSQLLAPHRAELLIKPRELRQAGFDS